MIAMKMKPKKMKPKNRERMKPKNGKDDTEKENAGTTPFPRTNQSLESNSWFLLLFRDVDA